MKFQTKIPEFFSNYFKMQSADVEGDSAAKPYRGMKRTPKKGKKEKRKKAKRSKNNWATFNFINLRDTIGNYHEEHEAPEVFSSCPSCSSW